jgi:hypothetical protein
MEKGKDLPTRGEADIKSSIAEKAETFARKAHGDADHRRKYSGAPYSVHLERVARLVATVSRDEEMIAAAWLHDTVEDTPTKIGKIAKRFGGGIAGLVGELTDVSTPADGNRRDRKAVDRKHTAAASARAKTIKLADLIDNCHDITENDPVFAAVFLGEMGQLLKVLGDGDPTLYEKAVQAHRECLDSLAKDGKPAPEGPQGEPRAPDPASSPQRRMRRLLNEGIPAAYIAEPLPSFDEEKDAASAREFMEKSGQEILGVRSAGNIAGYVLREDLAGGACGDHMRRFEDDQLLYADSPLARVINVLDRFETCFISILGQVGALVTREDMQKPPVRMWLFGMITILEMHFLRTIEERFPDDSWTEEVSEGRLEKARSLRKERTQKGQHPSLLDCLQLSDKAHILLRDAESRSDFGFESRKAGRREIKNLESLRNNLAHAQDIVTHDWAAITLIARRVDRIVSRL